MLELAVLAACEKGRPISGKGFVDKVSALTQDRWRVSPGLVYPLLRRMERDKLVHCEIAKASGRGRRELEYSMTPKGAAFLVDARLKGQSLLNEKLARLLPLATFAYLGDDDLEFIGRMTQLRLSFNDKLWKAATQGKARRLAELHKLADALEKS